MYKYIVYADEFKFKQDAKEPVKLILLFENPSDMRKLVRNNIIFSLNDYLYLFYKYNIIEGEEATDEMVLKRLKEYGEDILIVNGVVFDGVANEIDGDIPFNSEKNLCMKVPHWAFKCDHIRCTYDRYSTLVPIYSDGKQKYVCYQCGTIVEEE